MLLSSLFFNCFGVSMANELWMQIKLSWWSLIHFKRFWERSVLLVVLMLQIDLSVHITLYMTQHLMTHNEKVYHFRDIIIRLLNNMWKEINDIPNIHLMQIQIEMWIYMEFFFWKITYFYISIWIKLLFYFVCIFSNKSLNKSSHWNRGRTNRG